LATPDCSAQEKEILELNKRTNTLTKEIEGLRIELRALEEKNTVITGNLSSALEQAGGLREELGKLEDKYATLVAEKRALVSTNMELARELNELKGQNSIKQVISKFFDWLKAVIKK
jgi:chromosome segregation ATPase